MMQTIKNRVTARVQTVSVVSRGVLIDAVTFADRESADLYKRGVRQWAAERGIVVEVWSRTATALPAFPPSARQPLAAAC